MVRQNKTANLPAKPKRRPIAVAVFIAAAVLLVIGAVRLFGVLTGGALDTSGKVVFAQSMPVPALADSTTAADGTRIFNLNLQTGTTNFFDDAPTATWGVNGSYLGPTVRAKRGEKVRINVTNNLPEDSSIHWHGMHLPAKMDGGPHQPVAAGATWSPYWTIDQPAATLWYHPHPHGKTEAHVYRGVAGMFILDDDSAPASLPKTYGRDDFPVIVQDKNFTADRQFKWGGGGPTGTIGNEVIVNGVRTPYLDVTTQKVRLRLLNGSTARIYNFGLANGRNMQIIATDGGLLEKPVLASRVVLSPGERAEVIVDMTPGEQTILRSYPVDLGAGLIAQRRIGANDTLDILQLRAAVNLEPSAELPARLATLEDLSQTDAAQTRKFVLDSDRTINGKSMNLKRVDFSVTRDTSEVWEVTNRGGSPHNFHIHDVQFQIASFGGSTPPPHLQGWKDTVLIPEGKTVRLIMRFSDYSDPSFPYMYHCHLLRHEDQGMMGQFVVIEPGTIAPTELPSADHSHMQMQ